MTRPTWPTDPRFRRIAAAIADAVQLRSGPVSARNKMWCRCPLGCLYPKGPMRPWRKPKRLAKLGLTEKEFNHFVSGFDNDWSGPPFAELGREYRRRFP